jgi:prepilin-type N-terminal cleavage/methylation domain-containing protein
MRRQEGRVKRYKVRGIRYKVRGLAAFGSSGRKEPLSIFASHLPPPTSHRGFTLLELLVVLLLMAIITGFGAIYFAGKAGGSRTTQTAREITVALRQGRALAAETGEEQTLLVDFDSRSYGIEGKRTKVIPADIAIIISDPFQGEIGRGKYNIHLSPSGGVQGGTIHLTKGQSTTNIYLDPVVGARVGK